MDGPPNPPTIDYFSYRLTHPVENPDLAVDRRSRHTVAVVVYQGTVALRCFAGVGAHVSNLFHRRVLTPEEARPGRGTGGRGRGWWGVE